MKEQASKFLKTILCLSGFSLGFIVSASYCNYFKSYWYPPTNVWDEGYFIPAAAKYIEGIHFMEPHPPLGKLLIAASELLLRPLTKQDSTEGLEYYEEASLALPAGFTPTGYRFLPVLFSCFNALLFSLLLLKLLDSAFLALVFSSLYLFENSLIVQSRAAMLEGFLLFGVLLCLNAFFSFLNLDFSKTKNKKLWGLSFLMALGLLIAFMTKVLGLFLLVLWPLLYVLKFRDKKKLFLKFGLLSAFVVILGFHGIWYTHFKLTPKIQVTSPNGGMYGASADLEKVLLGLPRDFGEVTAFYIQLRDNIEWFRSYERAVQSLSLKNNTASTGSFPIMWPMGSSPIMIRSDLIPSSVGKSHQYLYFIPNALSWFFALFALVVSVGILCVQFFWKERVLSPRVSSYLFALLVLYFSYMLPMLFIRRELFLYHYLSPLLLTFLMLALLWKDAFFNREIFKKYSIPLTLFFTVGVIASFSFFKPLTYMEGLSCKEANARALFRFWDLRFYGCPDPADRVMRLEERKRDYRIVVPGEPYPSAL
ncbi:MAG: phospholipid carrier-dependent glycosyltransferase [Bdellovibrionota bacterium]